MSSRKWSDVGKQMKEHLKDIFTTDQIFIRNEIEANSLVSFTMIIMGVAVAVSMILMAAGVFDVDISSEGWTLLRIFLELLIPAILCNIFRGEGKWLKYLMMAELIIVLARVDSILSYNVTLIMVLPVILSCRYYNESFTKLTAVITAILFAVSSFCGTYFGMSGNDLNFITLKEDLSVKAGGDIFEAVRTAGVVREMYTKTYMLQSFLPRLIVFVIIALVCIRISKKGKFMVLEQARISLNTARIESELNLATDIQANMLPSIFPAFPDKQEFDIYATMSPAKEVGGDFYDFFMLDEKHVAFLVADVSGKGVPAALFMVIAKTLIKNNMHMGNSAGEVFTKVNQMLCEGNEAGLFVTAWMGVLDLTEGTLTYVNAGHNPPLIRRGNGDFEYLHSHPGFVLAGMEGIRYKEKTLQMEPGDRIFLYTDGVTEATNGQDELYGEDRLKSFLNQHREDHPIDAIRGVRENVDTFVGGADQFDDITMLMLEYKMPLQEEVQIEKEFDADVKLLHQVIGFVEEELEKNDCPPKESMQISVAVEEIFVNIASYAYTQSRETMKLAVTHEEDGIELRFSDHGLPFDPLAKQDPDITVPLEERGIGGLGILMVKKTMDDVQYKYENGNNILTLKKKWKK